MPYPLPKGHEFSITYLSTTSSHYMPVMCAAYDFYELSFLIVGDRKSVTPDAIYFMHSGSVTFTTPELLHKSSSIKGGSESYSRVLIKFSLKIGDEIKRVLGENTFETLCTEHVHYFDKEHTEKIHQMFFDLLEEYEINSPISEKILTGMLLRLLACIQRWKIPVTRPKISFQTENPLIISALDYIDSNMCCYPSLNETASYVGLAPAYFSRLFKQCVGSTFSDYISISKLLGARNMIVQTDLTLSEIAMTTGFSNGNYLSSVFHKHFHMTPTEYKRKYAGCDQYPDN